jgi:hypothetical protein
MTGLERRVMRARMTAQHYATLSGDPDEFILRDLLADLMHWCDSTFCDFDPELTRARDNFKAEQEEDAYVPIRERNV